MIKQVFDIEHYWKVVVFYNVDYDFFDTVVFELRKIEFSEAAIERLKNTMKEGKAKAVTCSSDKYHTSIVIFNSHLSKADYINSIVHEAEHIKQAILKIYNVKDRGEEPAYTIGYIVMKMYEVFRMLICK